MSKQDKEILKRMKMSQSEFARLIGVSRQSVSKGINKQRHYITLQHLKVVYNKINDPKKALLVAYVANQYFLNPDPTMCLLRKLAVTHEGRELIWNAISHLASEENIERWLRTHVPIIVEMLTQQK